LNCISNFFKSSSAASPEAAKCFISCFRRSRTTSSVIGLGPASGEVLQLEQDNHRSKTTKKQKSLVMYYPASGEAGQQGGTKDQFLFCLLFFTIFIFHFFNQTIIPKSSSKLKSVLNWSKIEPNENHLFHTLFFPFDNVCLRPIYL
jgi:hypothetical protein